MGKPVVREELDYYPADEERFNVYSHGLGFVLGLIGLVLLIEKALRLGNAWHLVSFSVFGLSIVLLFGASAIYHRAQQPQLRYRLQILDHASIYLLIGGSYTPFTLLLLRDGPGWLIFGIVWGAAAIGVCLKLFFTGRFNILSTAMYVLMGWTIIFFIQPLIDVLPPTGFLWLMAGGLFYTVGAIFFLLHKLRFNHAIFHVCVLVGCFCHYWTVYFHLFPQ